MGLLIAAAPRGEGRGEVYNSGLSPARTLLRGMAHATHLVPRHFSRELSLRAAPPAGRPRLGRHFYEKADSFFSGLIPARKEGRLRARDAFLLPQRVELTIRDEVMPWKHVRRSRLRLNKSGRHAASSNRALPSSSCCCSIISLSASCRASQMPIVNRNYRKLRCLRRVSIRRNFRQRVHFATSAAAATLIF